MFHLDISKLVISSDEEVDEEVLHYYSIIYIYIYIYIYVFVQYMYYLNILPIRNFIIK